jgi:transcriptional regulator with GAF, ATPase, and Fis domain
MKTLKIRFQDPSGDERLVSLSDVSRLSEEFRDVRVPTCALKVTRNEASNAWIAEVSDAETPIRLSDQSIYRMLIVPGLQFAIGDTRVQILEPNASVQKGFPPVPRGVSSWRTVTSEGEDLLRSLANAARTNLSVYIEGETGTGKEILAHLVHAWSARNTGPFVAINCAALPVGIAESELFGHVKGAYTGAHRDRPGALLQAHGGTLFLDEIGDLPLELQAKLLRFLECGEIRPVGSDRVMKSTVRVVSATHKPLDLMVKEKTFRQDLYYRLASVPLKVLPLRQRPQDIRLLATEFAEELGHILSQESLKLLCEKSWRGNARELKHAIERASGCAGGRGNAMLTTEYFEFLEDSAPEITDSAATVLRLQDMERVMLIRALKKTNGNRANAAKLLGVARSTLFEMLKRHSLRVKPVQLFDH